MYVQLWAYILSTVCLVSTLTTPHYTGQSIIHRGMIFSVSAFALKFTENEREREREICSHLSWSRGESSHRGKSRGEGTNRQQER